MAVQRRPPADPWALPTTARRVARPLPGPAIAAAAAVLGASGPCARLVLGSPAGALALGAVACATGALLAVRPDGRRGAVVAVLVAAAAWGAATPVAGRSAALLAVCGVVAADGALRGGPLWSMMPAPRVGVARLAVPLVVAGQLGWIRTGDRVLSGALLLAALVVVEAYHRRPGMAVRIERGASRTLSRAGSTVASVPLLVVTVPVLYLPGAVAGVVQRVRRRRRRESYWASRGSSAEREVLDAGRPFSSAPPRVRLTRNLVGVALLATACLATITLPVDRHGGADHRSSADDLDVFERARRVRFSDLASYRGVEFADDLKREQDRFSNHHLVPSEVGGYDVGDFSGRFTNVRDGVRRTLSPPECERCPRATVWLAGGSAAFGLGQRDEHTIASELVKLAAGDGVALEVVNLGVPGWTLHQEAAKVRARLAAGPAPDVVVFYDGFNDVLGTVISTTVHGRRPDEPAVLSVEDIRAFTGGSLDPRAAGSPEELGALAARKYRATWEVVRQDLERAGVGTLVYFQPDALADASQFEVVADAYRYPPGLDEYFDRALEAAVRQLRDEVVDLRHLLDDGPPVFADMVHTNERGARVVAERIHPDVRRSLRPPARG